jgi:L-asparaginase II
LLCAASPEGIGVVLKCEDGSQRAISPALATFFSLLAHELDDFARVLVENSRGEAVGEVVCL